MNALVVKSGPSAPVHVHSSETGSLGRRVQEGKPWRPTLTAMSSPAPDAAPVAPRWGVEVWLVLGISLGQSAIYSILSIADKLTRPQPLNQQTTTINNSVTPDRPWLDLSYQIAGIVFPVIPALLALYLLRLSGDRDAIGFDLRRPGFDLSRGVGGCRAHRHPGARPVHRGPRVRLLLEPRTGQCRRDFV